MKKLLFLGLSLLAGCSSSSDWAYEEPEYNRLAEHITVVGKTSNYVIYEYANIRVDEVAPVAAVYCHEKGGGRQASLYDITLHQNNRRRAVFVCK